MEYLKLIGILIIIFGFIFKFDVFAVVLISGIVTGLVSGLDIVEILGIIGEAFVNNRLMSIFLIIFPVLAIIERYGLKERASGLISNIKHVSVGKILSIYMSVRSLAAALNIRLGGHVQFVRPLILPMAQAAGEKVKGDSLSKKQDQEVKAYAAAVENFGNFFCQNCFPAASGVLLIQGTLAGLGYSEITLGSIAVASIPVALITVVFTIIQVLLYDRKLKKEGGK